MRVAVIDLGTNSVRFDVHSLKENRKPHALYREKVTVRLGEDVYANGKLSSNAVERTLKALQSFKHRADKLAVEKIVAVATSALREAKDASEFLARVKETTGIEFRVISGEEEARLIALGVLANSKRLKGYFALTDIGGGSTEVSLCKGVRQLDGVSFDLGTARLTQLFPKLIPDAKHESSQRAAAVDAARRFIRETLRRDRHCPHWPTVRKIIGSSGTIRSLVRLQKSLGKKGKRTLSRGSLHKLISSLVSRSVKEIELLPGIDLERIDIILGGAVLLEEVMEFLGARKVILTSFSLRDGLLEVEKQSLNSKRSNGRTSESAALSSARAAHSIQEVPMAFSRDFKRRMATCSILFRRLQKLHGLGDIWEGYLVTAVLLQGAVRRARSAQSRRSRVMSLLQQNLPTLKKWERRFLGELVIKSYQRSVSGRPPAFLEGKARRRAFSDLLAILRTARYAEEGADATSVLDNVKVGSRRVRLIVAARSASRRQRIRRQAINTSREVREKLFHRTFGRKLIVRRIAV